MAERRMFAKTIIDSDAFIDMPVTARLLYYDLAMRADDDGFVNSPKKIMRMVGASQDDLGILIMRKFILPFDNGVVVIKHWRIHNYIRKDTYSETTYKEQKALLDLDENRAYRLKTPGQEPIETEPEPACIQALDSPSTENTQCVDDPSTSRPRAVHEPSTQVRLGKDRLGNTPPSPPLGGETRACARTREIGQEHFDQFWKEYPRKVGKPKAKQAFYKAVKKEETFDAVMDGLRRYKNTERWTRAVTAGELDFIPHPTTWLNQRRWEDEIPEPAQRVPGVKESEHGMLERDYTQDELRALVHDPIEEMLAEMDQEEEA